MKGEILIAGERLSLSNSHITDTATLEDEFPWGITMKRAGDDLLADIPPWYSNNFCNYGVGSSADGKHQIYFCGCFNLTGAKIHKVGIDGFWYEFRGFGPAHYDDGSKYGSPTIYADAIGPDAIYTLSRSYHYPERRWSWRLQSEKGKISLSISLTPISKTFWFGKPRGPYIMHGLPSPKRKRTFDVWGGFIDFCAFTGKLKAPLTGEIEIKGISGMDREWHKRIGEDPMKPPPFHTVLYYNAFSLTNEEIVMLIYESINPWTGEVWCRQGRIDFPSKDLICIFDDFQYSDDGGLAPNKFKVRGEHERGSVDLTGVATERWGELRNVDGIPVVFNQPFIEWSGKITVDGEEIEVSALGAAELTRMKAT